MTKKEMIDFIKANVGTEFTYVYRSDGDTVRAYVKVFDPEIGLTCYTLDPWTRDGYRSHNAEDDGTWCVVGIHFDRAENHKNHTLKSAYDVVKAIVDTGKFKSAPDAGAGVSCAFM
jgi:hypothetical protein